MDELLRSIEMMGSQDIQSRKLFLGAGNFGHVEAGAFLDAPDL